MSVNSQLSRISDFPGYWARQRPEGEALVLGSTTINYQQFNLKIEALAQALFAGGVRKGDRVATLCTPRPEAIIIFLAAVRIGAIWVGLNPKYTLAELRYVVDDCRPKILFSLPSLPSIPSIPGFNDRDYISIVKTLNTECEFIETVAIIGHHSDPDLLSVNDFLTRASQAVPQELAHAVTLVDEKDAALIVYTSGTTGKPKGALLPHIGLVTCSLIQLRQFPAEPLRILNNLPINHIGCIGDIFCYALVAGGCTVFMESFSPADIPDVIEKNQISVWAQVPTMFQLVLEPQPRQEPQPTKEPQPRNKEPQPRNKEPSLTKGHPKLIKSKLSSLQRIIWSGAMAPLDLIEKLRDICPEIGSNYGMTETVGSIVYSDKNSNNEELARTIGRPLPDFKVRIASEEGLPVDPGDTGEIQVKGAFLMCGYHQAADKTEQAYTQDGWFKTGDLAVEEPNGLYRLIGRAKEMFKSGGYNVYPREVELVIESEPAVQIAAVVPVPDPLYQEVGHAFIQLEPGTAHQEVDMLNHCKQQLANYKIPKVFHFRESLPILPIGKIDKGTLKQEALRSLTHQDASTPST